MHDFVSRWQITEMSEWDQDYVNLVEPGYFLFTNDNLGEFVFGAVQGWVDARVSSREPFLEYSWQGVNEGDEVCGRGWFRFPNPDTGEGMLFIHNGDESSIVICRET